MGRLYVNVPTIAPERVIVRVSATVDGVQTEVFNDAYINIIQDLGRLVLDAVGIDSSLYSFIVFEDAAELESEPLVVPPNEMAIGRVTTEEVLQIINTEVTPLTAFMVPAHSLVERHLVPTGMTEAELKEIERWLTAHFIAIRDPRLRSRTVGDARETYAISGGYKGGLDGTPYGQQAMLLDYTGKLKQALDKRPVLFEAIEEAY